MRMNEDFFKGIFIAIGGAIGGSILTILTKFADGWIQGYFNEKERKAKHKRNVAREVHSICNEALTTRFQYKPRNMEHINHVVSDVEGVDKEMGMVINKFIVAWHECSNMSLPIPVSVRIAEKYRATLEEWANKIRC